MANVFKVLIDGVVHTFDNYDDIPETFENVVAFMPEIPPGPHTDEQHEEIEGWMLKFLALRKRETR